MIFVGGSFEDFMVTSPRSNNGDLKGFKGL